MNPAAKDTSLSLSRAGSDAHRKKANGWVGALRLEVMPSSAFNKSAILIMEDDENDAWLLQRALQKQNIRNPVRVVPDGEEGIAYLTGRGKYADRSRFPLPGFIITDLKMPLFSGLEVLKWLREHQDFKRIPILVLTSSRADSDVANAYGFGANSYMVKPTTFDDLEKLGRVILDYWKACELPPD